MTPQETQEFIKSYKKQMEEALDTTVVVGLPEGSAGSAVYGGGNTVLDIGARHEFGYGVPRRSFIREPINTKRDSINKTMDNQMKRMFNGEATAEQAFGIVGVKAVNVILDAFSTGGFGQWTPLSQETVDAKGSSAILQDTNTLKNSITWEVR